MSREDLIYLLLLLGSIVIGHFVKNLKSAFSKQLVSFGAGLFLVMMTAGTEGAWHSALTILGNFILVQVVGPRSCHSVSFLFVFGYLFFFRTCTWYGFAQPPKHCNAIQLLVTLRMVGLAFEIRQRHIDATAAKNDTSSTSDDKDINHLPDQPSLYDFYSYGYCYCGLMTGPYYSYKTYQDMLNQDGSKISTIYPALRALKYFPLFSIPYLILNSYYPINYMETEAYLEHKYGMIYQLFYFCPCFTWFRYRFYLGWMLAKTMCITMALGAYPFECEPKPGRGPTKELAPGQSTEPAKDGTGDTHSFETIHNIDIFDVELSCSVKEIMKAWNKTVQWWLYRCVHQQMPFKRLRMTLVLLVSAFWHGVHPGYYFTFMSVPLLVTADTRVRRTVTPYLNAKQLYIYDWLCWFVLYRAMEYLSIGFLLLRIDVIMKVYLKMYFVGHIALVIIILITFLIPKKRVPVDSDPKSPLKVD